MYFVPTTFTLIRPSIIAALTFQYVADVCLASKLAPFLDFAAFAAGSLSFLIVIFISYFCNHPPANGMILLPPLLSSSFILLFTILREDFSKRYRTVLSSALCLNATARQHQ